jgi:hypothetical protein
MEKWLLLTDYASKYRISVSTLRRRIKAGAQAHRFEAGRYYLPDQYEPMIDPSPSVQVSAQPIPQLSVAPINTASAVIPAAALAAPLATPHIPDEPLITTTSKLLNELKQAYTLILHEKEEQIIYLKEEIADLKTLVRVLESDNARLRKTPAGNA